eukprot:scaffold1381_cov386-Prasinococcus_capsulatus_cf.AAC.12
MRLRATARGGVRGDSWQETDPRSAARSVELLEQVAARRTPDGPSSNVAPVRYVRDSATISNWPIVNNITRSALESDSSASQWAPPPNGMEGRERTPATGRWGEGSARQAKTQSVPKTTLINNISQCLSSRRISMRTYAGAIARWASRCYAQGAGGRRHASDEGEGIHWGAQGRGRRIHFVTQGGAPARGHPMRSDLRFPGFVRPRGPRELADSAPPRKQKQTKNGIEGPVRASPSSEVGPKRGQIGPENREKGPSERAPGARRGEGRRAPARFELCGGGGGGARGGEVVSCDGHKNACATGAGGGAEVSSRQMRTAPPACPLKLRLLSLAP